MLYYSSKQIVLQEVPDEISLALSISGCPLRCKGCHSKETYNNKYGNKLDNNELQNILNNSKHITCVLFYGGEWNVEHLIELLKTSRAKHKKTCLYTGYELKFINKKLFNFLDYIKVNPYIESLGGLQSEKTNQIFYTIKNGKIENDITYKFNKGISK